MNRYSVDISIFGNGEREAAEYRTVEVWADSREEAAEKAVAENERRDVWVKVVRVRKVPG